MWKKIEEGKRSAGFRFSDVVREEEYGTRCRVMLERFGEGHLAITCVLLGSMIHSVICREENCMELFEAMKNDLAAIADRGLPFEEEQPLCDCFERKFRTPEAYFGGKDAISTDCK